MRYALIAARKARGWSQQALADKVDIDRTAISHYERGKQDITGKMLEKLAEHLQTPMDVLYKDTPIRDFQTHEACKQDRENANDALLPSSQVMELAPDEEAIRYA